MAPWKFGIRAAYAGSDAKATIAALDALRAKGIDGELAAYLFRALKASRRAKRYRGGMDTANGFQSYRALAYKRKGDALRDLAEFLEESGGEAWGWGLDHGNRHKHVLYIDLPNGQVSFHSPKRYAGPNYRGKWDRANEGEKRILDFCEEVLRGG